ncbi:9686_t:CDS:2, partial [Cetraspora pellucida]
ILLIINLFILQTNAARCGICGIRGHNRRTCPNRLAMVPYNPNNALIPPYQQNNALIPYIPQTPIIPQTSMMNKWNVPWMSNMIMIRKRPAKGKICSHCGAMGHNRLHCPIQLAGANVANVNNIKKSVKKYFDSRKLNLRMCRCCGEIGHTGRNCPTIRANNLCIPLRQLSEIKKGINEFKKHYGINNRLVPQFMLPQNFLIPKRPRIPNYIAACGCCGNENHNRYDPQCPFQNGLVQPCLNPRLIKSIRELRLWYVENNRPVPPNIGVGLNPLPKQPPPIPPRPPPIPPRPGNNGNGNNNIPLGGIGLQNLQNQFQQHDQRLVNLIRQSEIQLETILDRINRNINTHYTKTNNNIFNRFNQLNQRILTASKTLDEHGQNINQIGNNINLRFNNLDRNINNRFGRINDNIINMNQRFDIL